jgi:thiol-disulfide isomerase/thioredoxin
MQFKPIVLFLLLGLFLLSCKQEKVESVKDLSIKGQLTSEKNQLVRLQGYNGFNTYSIDSTFIDKDGKFELNFTEQDFGAGILSTNTENSFLVILSGDGLTIQGSSFSKLESIQVTKGKNNLLFQKYAREYPIREQVSSAWDYLKEIYGSDSLFSRQKAVIQDIEAEQKRINEEENSFLKNLPEGSFLAWYLPTRKTISSVSTIAQYRQEEIPATITYFRDLDYSNPWFYKSGLLQEALESHFWLLDNSGKSLEESFSEMKTSIDAICESLTNDEKKYNEVIDYLFDLLERYSLFEASEYLALKALNQNTCTLNTELANQLETYRAMKKGNIAPDFQIVGDFLNNPTYKPSKLSEIRSEYVLVVFAASWCPKCTEEIPELGKLYSKWKGNGVEVIGVSLDDDPKNFKSFFGQFSFPSICDYKRWNGSIVNQYYVFSTPTMFLLDNKREILLRPTSVKQMDAWVDWVITNGNQN